jgi:hypothetical protein
MRPVTASSSALGLEDVSATINPSNVSEVALAPIYKRR